MPKSFQFGKKKRNAKPRGLSLVKQSHSEKVNKECCETPPTPMDCTTTTAAATEKIDSASDVYCPSIPSFQSSASISSGINSSSTTSTDAPTQTTPSASRIESKLAMYSNDTSNQIFSDGGHFLLVHTSFLNSLVSLIECPTCRTRNVSIHQKQKEGLAIKFEIRCEFCDSLIWSDYTSPRGPKRFDINTRAVLSSKENAIGYDKLLSFFSLMNIPSPMHRSTYYDIAVDVHKAAVDAAECVMDKAAAVIQERHSSGSVVSDKVSNTGCPVTTVSFDGTWQKRGHSSHNGVGVVIDVDTGLVIDTHTVSNFCGQCEKGPKKGTDGFDAWFELHKQHCQKNSDCSSNGMEVVAAGEIFGRSITNRGLVYGNILCDGDSKSFEHVKEKAGYDVEVEKLDCINHIAKRMFNALDNVKKSHKSELNRKLTRPMIDKITNTYAKNLKDNAPDVYKMKNGVMGGILHMTSTDEKPNHRLCPKGEHSWCPYQKAIAKHTSIPSHNPTFKADILPYIWPTIQRLTDPDLLRRCSDMLTQNANESFNSLIWKRCPKTSFANRRSVETAVALSVISFNCGPGGLRGVMNRLDLRWEKICENYASTITADKIRRASRKSVGLSKWKRKHRKSLRITKEAEKEASEGPTYQSGAFNL